MGSANDPQLRVDPLTGLRVIVAAARSGRPGGGFTVEPPPEFDPASDPFALGSEAKTPPELWADRPNGGAADSEGWLTRAVPNLYPALVVASDEPALSDPLLATRGMPQLHAQSTSCGSHEVIVNSPRSVQSLGQLSADELDDAIRAWTTRIAAHADSEGVAYVHLCVNEGRIAGASLPHTHAQLYALPFVPALIARERERMRSYHEQTQGHTLLEDVIADEVRSAERVVAIDEDAVLITPFASNFPFQMMLVPRKPSARFDANGQHAGPLLHKAFAALTQVFGTTPPLNLWIRTAPSGAVGYCWRIDIVPRLTQPASLELGTGVHINSVAPEAAAQALRAALEELDAQ
ncbi:MAG: DUF4921 family protein [Thermoleophilaceae bacterium]|nr:DUF4921 family protein [Thermoleophilaceae bacterium]